jgi:hypothetical protein
MRKFCLASLFALFLAINLPAQGEDIRIGFLMSPRFTWITTNVPLVNGAGTNLGINLGTTVEYYFSENYALTMGLGLAFNQGGTLKHDIGGNLLPESDLSDNAYNTGDKPLPDGVEIKYKLQYLEVPISLKLRTREFGYTRFFVEAPILSWSVRTQVRGEIKGDGIDTEKENIKEDVSAFNFSWGLGAGIEYFISTQNSIVAGIGYKRGFYDLTTNKAKTAMHNPDEDPSNPDDDYITSREDSKGVLNGVTIKLGLIF